MSRWLLKPQEQQIGGWTQVSAHGTGARIPPVDVAWLCEATFHAMTGVGKTPTMKPPKKGDPSDFWGLHV